MLVILHPGTDPELSARVLTAIEQMGGRPVPMTGYNRSAILVEGDRSRVDPRRLRALPGVEDIISDAKPFRRAARESVSEPTVLKLPGGLTIGGEEIVIMAGPCAVESAGQLLETARAVRAAGATVLRAGAFKPRTSPYSFQGLGVEGLKLLAQVRSETGLLIVTEAMDVETLEPVAEVADIIQIGSRNMVNYSLLKAVGRLNKPVLLKRGMAATITELLLSAEYILSEGNPNVILCERGVRGFDSSTRNVFDLSAIPLVHQLSHLPIIADPSHGTGDRHLVPAMARAAIAAGADGLLIEVHHQPDLALSDGGQSLFPEQFSTLMRDVHAIASLLGRRVAAAELVP